MIVFDSDKANDWRQSIQKLARSFEQCEFQLNTVINGLDMEIAARSEIEVKLSGLREKARRLREGLDAMAAMLSRAGIAYGDADRKTADMIRRLTEEWKESERRLAPMLSRANLGLSAQDAERIAAIRALDGLFMSSSRMDFENYTAHFKPLDVKFTVLPEDMNI